VRQTGHAMPTMAMHAQHNSSHLDGYTWADDVAARQKRADERGVRFERATDESDDLDEAA